MKVIIHTDGGSRGNPGPAAAGFVLEDIDGQRLQAKAFFLGETTNNVAEYTALIKALEAARKLGAEQVVVHSDSELMVRQLSGAYKVKSEAIRPLFEHVNELRSQFESCLVRHVRREKNEEADRLVNQALDARRHVEEKPASQGHPHAAHEAPGRDEAPGGLLEEKLPKKRIRLGILISGGGRTMLNILDAIQRGELQADIALVISSLSAVAGVGRARHAGLPLKIVRKKDCADVEAFSKQIADGARCRPGGPGRAGGVAVPLEDSAAV